MNAAKNPRHARKLAKQQQHLRKVARKNPDALNGRERAMCDWDVHIENYDVLTAKPQRRQEEDQYDEYE